MVRYFQSKRSIAYWDSECLDGLGSGESGL